MKNNSLAVAAFSAIAALALAGCSVHDYELARPELAPAAQLSSQPWHTSLNDENLVALIKTALDNNEDIRMAANNLLAAKATSESANIDLWPSINATAGANITRAKDRSGEYANAKNFSLGAQLAWQLDFWGELRNIAKADAIAAKQSELSLLKIRDTVSFGVAKLYYQAAASLQEAQIISEFERAQREQLGIYERQFRLGAISKTDFTKLKADYEKTRIRQVSAQSAAKKLTQALSTLVFGLNEQREEPNLHIPSRLPEFAAPELMPSEWLLNRPDIAAAALEVERLHFRAKAVRASFFPRFSLSASAIAAGEEDIFSSPTYGLGINLLQPLFNLGKNNRALKRANLAQDNAVLGYEKALKNALKEIRTAVIEYSAADENLQRYSEVIALEREIFEDAKTRYRTGETSLLDYLDAQRALLSSQLQANQLRLARLLAAIDLYDASGMRQRPQ